MKDRQPDPDFKDQAFGESVRSGQVIRPDCRTITNNESYNIPSCLNTPRVLH